jgi:hypothetical protein
MNSQVEEKKRGVPTKAGGVWVTPKEYASMTGTPLPTVYFQLQARKIAGARKHVGAWLILRAYAEQVVKMLTQGEFERESEALRAATDGPMNTGFQVSHACSVTSGFCPECGQRALELPGLEGPRPLGRS